MRKIIDVSTFQGKIDWGKAKPNISGAIIRAGYGQNNIDAQFKRNIEECNRLGIPCGVYWFSYAYNAALATNEAEYCLDAIKPYRLELPVAFDWEYDSVNYAKRNGVNPSPVLANKLAESFCRTIEKNGYYAMLYTNGDFLSRYFTNVSAFDLWYAAWPTNPDPSNPPRKCGIWQYGSTIVPGINGGVDTNESYRDYPAIIKAAGLNHLADTPERIAGKWAVEKGLVKEGYIPDESITRQEVIEMLYKLNK